MATPLTDALITDYKSKEQGETRDHPASHNATNLAVKELRDATLKTNQVGTDIAPLVGGKVPTSFIPSLSLTGRRLVVATEAERLNLVLNTEIEQGDIVHQTSDNSFWLLSTTSPSQPGSWVLVDSSSGVTSVNGQSGVITLTASDVGALPVGSLNGLASVNYVDSAVSGFIHSSDLAGYATTNYVDGGVNSRVPNTAVGAPNGIATLGVDGKVPSTQSQVASVAGNTGVVTAAQIKGAISYTAAEVGAKPASYAPLSTDISDSSTVGRSVLTATSAANARTAIGAGTSNLAVGTNATDAKAGNYQPTAANISDSTTLGRSLVTAVDAAAARSAIAAASTAGNETWGGVKTFSSSPVVPNPTTAGQAANKGYVDGAISTFQNSLDTAAADPITIPEGMFKAYSSTGISTQSIAGIRSTLVMDKGTAGQAISVIHAIGIVIPPDWVTFNLEMDLQLFGAAVDAATNTIRCSVTCVQYGDPGAVPTNPTHVWQNVTVTPGAQTSIIVTSTAPVARTGPRCIFYFARDPQAAVAAGDTFGSRLIPESGRIIKAS